MFADLRNQASSPLFQQKYGALALGLNPTKKLAMLYNVLFMFRRLVVVALIVFLGE